MRGGARRGAGRPALPVALHLARGTFRRDRHGEKPAPVVAPGKVLKPSGLSEAAARVWDELAPICVALGTLTRADQRAFGVLCELQATCEAASATKGASAVGMRAERLAAAAVRPYYELFGLAGPLSRTRLPKPAVDDFDPFLDGPRPKPKSKWTGIR